MIFDHRRCELGEGPLWHPLREQLFWFDITAGVMLSQDATGPRQWAFPQMVSAAGWVSADRLLIAGEAGLFLFDLATESSTPLSSSSSMDRATASPRASGGAVVNGRHAY